MHKINVVTVSFAQQMAWVNGWLEETNSPFPMLVDPELRAYQAYGLARSVLHSWGINNLRYHAHALWRGERLNLKRGDTNQLGGDFLIDRAGVVRLAHPSKEPTDRPDITTLLTYAALLGTK